eukprot:TRINITY_DN9993_c0_g1_i2.p1 TRINITY_DN9993_c0_g1~~TRINITY_DN9993_c0_g1_i2.p1  ORF type:complete len:320 (+),score=55.73 TRINITY_DN9993_c0_g1_i2:97-1056(+)
MGCSGAKGRPAELCKGPPLLQTGQQTCSSIEEFLERDETAPPAADFEVVLERRLYGETLGLAMSTHNKKLLQVEKLRTKGMIPAWNASHESTPEVQVRIGDWVLAVNGVWGNADLMITEVVQETVRLSIKRDHARPASNAKEIPHLLQSDGGQLREEESMDASMVKPANVDLKILPYKILEEEDDVSSKGSPETLPMTSGSEQVKQYCLPPSPGRQDDMKAPVSVTLMTAKKMQIFDCDNSTATPPESELGGLVDVSTGTSMTKREATESDSFETYCAEDGGCPVTVDIRSIVDHDEDNQLPWARCSAKDKFCNMHGCF